MGCLCCSTVNKKAVLSQGEPRDAAVNFDTRQILQEVDNGTFMYAKHGNIVDTDRSVPKPAQNTLRHV